MVVVEGFVDSDGDSEGGIGFVEGGLGGVLEGCVVTYMGRVSTGVRLRYNWKGGVEIGLRTDYHGIFGEFLIETFWS